MGASISALGAALGLPGCSASHAPMSPPALAARLAADLAGLPCEPSTPISPSCSPVPDTAASFAFIPSSAWYEHDDLVRQGVAAAARLHSRVACLRREAAGDDGCVSPQEAPPDELIPLDGDELSVMAMEEGAEVVSGARGTCTPTSAAIVETREGGGGSVRSGNTLASRTGERSAHGDGQAGLGAHCAPTPLVALTALRAPSPLLDFPELLPCLTLEEVLAAAAAEATAEMGQTVALGVSTSPVLVPELSPAASAGQLLSTRRREPMLAHSNIEASPAHSRSEAFPYSDWDGLSDEDTEAAEASHSGEATQRALALVDAEQRAQEEIARTVAAAGLAAIRHLRATRAAVMVQAVFRGWAIRERVGLPAALAQRALQLRLAEHGERVCAALATAAATASGSAAQGAPATAPNGVTVSEAEGAFQRALQRDLERARVAVARQVAAATAAQAAAALTYQKRREADRREREAAELARLSYLHAEAARLEVAARAAAVARESERVVAEQHAMAAADCESLAAAAVALQATLAASQADAERAQSLALERAALLAEDALSRAAAGIIHAASAAMRKFHLDRDLPPAGLSKDNGGCRRFQGDDRHLLSTRRLAQRCATALQAAARGRAERSRGGNPWTAHQHALVRARLRGALFVQALWRGHRLRKRLLAALASVPFDDGDDFEWNAPRLDVDAFLGMPRHPASPLAANAPTDADESFLLSEEDWIKSRTTRWWEDVGMCAGPAFDLDPQRALDRQAPLTPIALVAANTTPLPAEAALPAVMTPDLPAYLSHTKIQAGAAEQEWPISDAGIARLLLLRSQRFAGREAPLPMLCPGVCVGSAYPQLQGNRMQEGVAMRLPSAVHMSTAARETFFARPRGGGRRGTRGGHWMHIAPRTEVGE